MNSTNTWQNSTPFVIDNCLSSVYDNQSAEPPRCRLFSHTYCCACCLCVLLACADSLIPSPLTPDPRNHITTSLKRSCIDTLLAMISSSHDMKPRHLSSWTLLILWELFLSTSNLRYSVCVHSLTHPSIIRPLTSKFIPIIRCCRGLAADPGPTREIRRPW